MTLKEARERGYRIEREVRFFAVNEDGVRFVLYPDWHLEALDEKLEAQKKEAAE